MKNLYSTAALALVLLTLGSGCSKKSDDNKGQGGGGAPAPSAPSAPEAPTIETTTTDVTVTTTGTDGTTTTTTVPGTITVQPLPPSESPVLNGVPESNTTVVTTTPNVDISSANNANAPDAQVELRPSVPITIDLQNQKSSEEPAAEVFDELLAQDILKKNVAGVKKDITTTKNIDAKNNHGETVLHLAVQSGNEAIVKLILSKKPNVNITDRDQQSPLRMAVATRNKKIVNLLLATKGIDVNSKDIMGWSALHEAASKCEVEIANALIAKKADVNASSFYGWSPLDIALYATLDLLKFQKNNDLAGGKNSPIAKTIRKAGGKANSPIDPYAGGAAPRHECSKK